MLAVPFHLRPENFIVDDGYFYPQIARYIAHGAGSTFNGITPTNGYHPLWMAVCVLAAWITSSSNALIQILASLQDLLLVASVVLVVSIARRYRLRGAVLGCAPLLFFGMVLGIWRLLETNLSLALQLCVLVLVVPVFPQVQEKLAGWRDLVLGILLGLTMLARLDLGFFVLIVLLYQLVHKVDSTRSRPRLGSVLLQGVVAGALLAPYLVWNWKTFHHLLPISGAIKSTFPHVQHWALAPFMYPVVAAIVLNSCLLFRSVRNGFDTICLLTAVAAALHMIYTISFGELAPWYLTTGYLTVSLCMIWVADLALRRMPGSTWLEPALASFLFLAFLLLSSARLFSNFTYTRLLTGQLSLHGTYLEPKKAFGLKLAETLPPGSRMMIFDAPGGVAFYSHMSLLPIDGLVSDYAYNSDVVSDTLLGYTGKHHIDYFIAPYLRDGQSFDRLYLRGNGTAEGQVMTVEAPLTHQSAGAVTLTNANLVLRFREINPNLEAVFPEVGVWRIPHPQN